MVIGRALELLSSIHSSYTDTVADDGAAHGATTLADTALEDAKRRRILHALLDLISLEGIYPCLSSGAGIPLQDRVISVLPSGVIARDSVRASGSSPRDESLLIKILDALLSIVFDPRPSIQPVIRGRILSDLISGTADLSLQSQTLSDEHRAAYHKSFLRIIDEYGAKIAMRLALTDSPQNTDVRRLIDTIQLPASGHCQLVQISNIWPNLAYAAA